MQKTDVVITGVGLLTPIGIGSEAFWTSLCNGHSGVDLIRSFDTTGLPVRIAAEIADFEPKKLVSNRKQLKVMCRDAQLGVAAAEQACRNAKIEPGKIIPERFGIVLGADRICTALDDSEPSYRACMPKGQFDFSLWGSAGMEASFPLNFLKVLPNMIASHISIVLAAQGPNNTIHQAEVSSLLAVAEAAEVIRRGAADVMLAGGASSQLNPFDCIRHCVMGGISHRQDDPAAAMRPFDADRDGQVWGEGAAVLVLENRAHAESRGANILARLCAASSTCDPPHNGKGLGLRRAMQLACERSVVGIEQIDHVNAHGASTADEDPIEAEAIRDATPGVPVTAPSSYFGNLGAAAGAVEMAATVLAFGKGEVPPTLNYKRPDPSCPIPVIHDEPKPIDKPAALLVNRTMAGQSVALVVTGS